MTIHKSIEVKLPREAAWDAFTTRIGSWWPTATHSIAGRRAIDVIVEPREGGVLYEVQDDGKTAVWADVVAWDPPERLVLAWRVNPEQPVTEVEIRFSAADDESTRVELEHRGWPDDESRSSYDEGWGHILGLFVKAVA